MFQKISQLITKKPLLNGYVYDFSVDCNTIGITDIINIHKYSMKKHYIK